MEDRARAGVGGARWGERPMNGLGKLSAHPSPGGITRLNYIPLASLEEVAVCGPCGDAVGPHPSSREPGTMLIQAGECSTHTDPGQLAWPGYDFNRYVELCRCCGTVPLRSGTRWATWFCGPCMEQVKLLNERLGRYAIPVGRHSLHQGRLLSPEHLEEPLEVQIFLDATNAAFDAMKLLKRWAAHIVRMNLRAIREDDDAVVPLRVYAHAAQVYVDPFDRFREMCEWLGRESRVPREEGDAS